MKNQSSRVMSSVVVAGSAVLSSLSTVAFGNEESTQTQNDFRLSTVTVVGQREQVQGRLNPQNAIGAHTLNQQALEDFGSATGNLSDSLDTLPNVQFSEDVLKPEEQYDIRPQSISISGGRTYENNFQLDGISNDSRLDPVGAASEAAINDLPSHEQAIFIDTADLKSVTVYDSNVPAEFGRFTGGVVDAKSKTPERERKTTINVSGTRSDWNNYFILTQPQDPTDPTESEPPTEPEFKRDRFHISHTMPIGLESAGRFSLGRTSSSIPILSLGQTEQKEQQNLNVSATFNTPIRDNADLSVTMNHAPYESTSLIKNAKDSELKIEGGGTRLTSTLKVDTDTTEHDLKIGASFSQNNRTAPKDFYNWANTKSRRWGLDNDLTSSKEGGFGDLEKHQNQLTVNWKAKRDAQLANQAVTFNYGVEVKNTEAGFKRKESTSIYSDPITNSGVQCLGQTSNCVQNEQYFSQRKVYPEDDVSVSLLESSAFAEATVKKGRLKTTVGARLDHDDFLKNTNVGWRTRASFDAFDDGKTTITAGLNRYYGGALLSYKLREAAKPYQEEYRGTTQNVINEWQIDSGQGSFKYRFDDVDTPYSDEISLGVKQKLAGGVGEVKLLSRDNKDEFARTTTETQPDGFRYYLMNNDGSSRYQSVSVSWDKKKGKTTYGIYASYSKTESTNDDYDDTLDATPDSAAVWYNGQRTKRGELDRLRADFARPIVAGAYISHEFKHGLKASFKARLRGKYDTIVETGREHSAGVVTNPDGSRTEEKLTIYDDKTLPTTVLSDVKFAWQPPKLKNTIINLDINNVFDRRTHTVASGKEGIETGRSVWLGLKTSF